MQNTMDDGIIFDQRQPSNANESSRQLMGQPGNMQTLSFEDAAPDGIRSSQQDHQMYGVKNQEEDDDPFSLRD